jgi:MoCo/4Fe-4S cofactor protein with predicted Tat translocation signal
MSKKQYWKGLEELNPTTEFKQKVSNEFAEEIPMGDFESIANAPASRRDFLKIFRFFYSSSYFGC